MALPATLPPWLQTVNTGMFGRGAQLGEEMRANRAAEQFKQQELMRQRQQDAIAQQQHQQEMQRQAQRDAINDQQWKAEFGLKQEQNKARIDAAAKKFAAQQAYGAAVAAANGDPRKIADALAKYGPAMGVNPGPMLSAQERTRSADVDRRNRAAVALHNAQMRNAEQRRKDALKETPQQRERREERELQIKDLQKEIQQFQKDNDLGLKAGGGPEHEKARQGLLNELSEMKGKLDALYAAPSNQENKGANVSPAGGTGAGNTGSNAPAVRRYDVNGNPITQAKMTGANAPPVFPRVASPTAAPITPAKAPAQPVALLPPTLPRLGANAPAIPTLGQAKPDKSAVLQRVLGLPDSELANAAKAFGVQASTVGDGRFFVGDPSNGKEYSKDDFVNLLTDRAKEQGQPQTPPPASLPFPMLSATPQ